MTDSVTRTLIGDFVQILGSKFWALGDLSQQESPVDARVTRDSAVISRWPISAIMDIIEPEIAPFDPPTPKTLAYNQTWSGSDAPFARYSPLKYTVILKLGFGVTQGHRKRHYSIEDIRLYIRLP